MRSAYVIATWGGRRCQRDFQPVDILAGHFTQLSKIVHDSDVFLLVPDNPDGNVPGFDRLVKFIEGLGLAVIFRRSNIGWSYGGYNDIFARYRKAYDVYIFYEDDYYPVGNHFDRAWRNMIARSGRDVGMVCGWARSNKRGPHAANSICACPSWALQRVWDKYGCLPHEVGGCDGWRPEWHTPQVGFSGAFHHAGLKITDVMAFGYKSPYWYGRYHHIRFANKIETGPMLFFPGQKFELASCAAPTS